MAGHSATVEVGQLLELGGAHRALDVGVEGSCCFEGDHFLLAGDVPPVEDYQEDEHRDDQSNDDLEEVIPNVVDIGRYFLSQFSAFLGIIGLEEL